MYLWEFPEWIGLSSFLPGPGLIPGQGTKIPQAAQRGHLIL